MKISTMQIKRCESSYISGDWGFTFLVRFECSFYIRCIVCNSIQPSGKEQFRSLGNLFSIGKRVKEGTELKNMEFFQLTQSLENRGLFLNSRSMVLLKPVCKRNQEGKEISKATLNIVRTKHWTCCFLLKSGVTVDTALFWNPYQFTWPPNYVSIDFNLAQRLFFQRLISPLIFISLFS